ncbi:Proline-responsive transcriptional activator PutR [Dissostichus eleginoides]|uniref:Proline-responsive transcriptional activator PutR n=1 Tax=Dissostichus eleginoides TaxID=100907 RepID=A0AAD9F1K7_DISEL|nr:Proline-responsive transcriptional activator PutR [Dissostichus eleginoides]
MVSRAVGTTLPQNIRHVQHDLRDLMSQVSTQMSYMRSSWTKPTFPTPLNPQNGSQTVWDSSVEGYIILRDLDLYLTRLARDFLFLASKHTDDSVLKQNRDDKKQQNEEKAMSTYWE